MKHNITLLLALCLAGLASLLVCVPYGISRMVEVYTAINILWVAVWFVLARREIDLKLSEVICDVGPYLLLSIGIVAGVYLVTRRIDNLYLSLAVKVVAVGTSYCMALWLLRSTIFREAITFITKKKIG